MSAPDYKYRFEEEIAKEMERLTHSLANTIGNSIEDVRYLQGQLRAYSNTFLIGQEVAKNLYQQQKDQ